MRLFLFRKHGPSVRWAARAFYRSNMSDKNKKVSSQFQFTAFLAHWLVFRPLVAKNIA
jgi:hypothetical protein